MGELTFNQSVKKHIHSAATSAIIKYGDHNANFSLRVEINSLQKVTLYLHMLQLTYRIVCILDHFLLSLWYKCRQAKTQLEIFN